MPRAGRSGPRVPPHLAAKAATIHRRAIVIDAMAGSLTYPPVPPIDGQAYLDLLAEGGVTGYNAILVSQPTYNATLRDTLRAFNENYRFLEAYRDRVLEVSTAADIERAKRQGKLAVIFGTESSTMLEDDLGLVAILHRLGMRIMQLTYNERNLLGDGCLETTDLGLTNFGSQVVRAMQAVGIVVDLAHASPKTCLDAIEVARLPVIVSHANARAVCPNPRNLTDDVLKAVAATGGVIGATPYAPFCQTKPGVPATIEDFFIHLDYLVKAVGVDHVGIGTDYFENKDPVTWTTAQRYPQVAGGHTIVSRRAVGFARASDFPRVTEGLVARGWPEADIRKVLGENFLRVFRRCWRA